MVSIHAPTWGATSFPSMVWIFQYPFQSTHPHGVRPRLRREYRVATRVSIHAPTWGATAYNRKYHEHKRFQSTHPHGVRREYLLIINFTFGFNPRTHMGCDIRANGQLGLGSSVSIHAPTWGATSGNLISFKSPLFQSTHPHGVRLCFLFLGRNF